MIESAAGLARQACGGRVGAPGAARARAARRRGRTSEQQTLRITERRQGNDRRKLPRGTSDRRVQAGPGVALRLAKMRLSRDADYLYKNAREGNWAEVARVCSGLAGEVGSIVGSLALFPLVLAGTDLPRAGGGPKAPKGAEALDAPKPKRAKGADADRPVVLVHGWFHNRTAFLLMKRRLQALGKRHVYAVDLPTSRMGVQRLADILATKIDRIREMTGAQQVDVVGHSLGGLVARWWMHHCGGVKCVKNLVTLGAPHKGTALAAFLPIGSGRAISPGSWTLAALQLPPPKGVKVTVIWSDMDYLILPLEDDAWHSEEGSVRVKYAGHLSLLYSKSVFREVWRALGGGNGTSNRIANEARK